MKARNAFVCLLLLVSTASCATTGGRSDRDAATALAAVDVTGRWIVTISLDGETISGVALLTQNGDEVTGSIGPDERNQHPLEGVVEREQITLTTLPRPGRTVAFDKCYLTLDGETLKGRIERAGSSDGGTIEFRRMDE